MPKGTMHVLQIDPKIVQEAELGDPEAQFTLGLHYYVQNGDNTETVRWFRKAAEQGLIKAQSTLGILYQFGDGVPKDHAEAAKWYNLAANQDERMSAGILADMYANGDGVWQDNKEALKWYLRAATLGNSDVQAKLGKIYSSGIGAPKNEIEGLAWTYIASASGALFAPTAYDVGVLERNLGHQLSIVAQQRSKELLTEIEAAKSSAKMKTAPVLTGTNAKGDMPKASGSGAIVSRKGLVVTAAHVIAGASSMRVLTDQGLKNAKVLQIDGANDIAILQLEEGTYPSLTISPSRRVRLGQAVATIGFPNVQIQGFSPKVTRGEISSLNGEGDDPRTWQISVPVQPGNSGGPLLDQDGNLVGVIVSKLGLEAARATNDLPQNVSYAVKGTYALALLDQYLDGTAPEVARAGPAPKFEDMVATAQRSVVLILAY